MATINGQPGMGEASHRADKHKTELDTKALVHTQGENGALCEKMSFAVAESYKMLRTKINLMLPQKLNSEGSAGQEHQCRVIGVTSALRGEGKTTTAINLAYTVAEAGHMVCIVEADMRLPNLSKRLSLRQSPGLSNFLTGQNTAQDWLQRYSSKNGVKFSVVTAGDIPPTPSELLESKNMSVLLEALSKSYDFIIVDLPPVTIVTDALSVSKLLDGMLLVVRKNYCDKSSLRDVMYQFNLTGTKAIGVVFNCSTGPMGSSSYYRRKKSYRRYYKKDYGYAGSKTGVE